MPGTTAVLQPANATAGVKSAPITSTVIDAYAKRAMRMSQIQIRMNFAKTVADNGMNDRCAFNSAVAVIPPRIEVDYDAPPP